eukprot:176591-Chlamydomonas_euryale.AAC.2
MGSECGARRWPRHPQRQVPAPSAKTRFRALHRMDVGAIGFRVLSGEVAVPSTMVSTSSFSSNPNACASMS